MVEREEASAYGWLSRLKSKPLVAVLIVGFTVGIAVLKAPVELMGAVNGLFRAFGYDPAGEAQKRKMLSFAFTFGKELGNAAWYQYVKDKTGKPLPSDLQSNYDTALSNASGRATLLTLPIDVKTLDLKAAQQLSDFPTSSNGYRSAATLINQTKGQDVAKAFSVGFASSSYFWRAQSKNFTSASGILSFESELTASLNELNRLGFPPFQSKMSGDANRDRIIVGTDILNWQDAVADHLAK